MSAYILSIKDLINMNKLKRIQVVMGLIIIIVVMFIILSVNFLWPNGRQEITSIIGGLSLWFAVSFWVYAERVHDIPTKKASFIVASLWGIMSVMMITLKLRSYTDDLFVTLYQLAGTLVFLRLLLLLYENIVIVFTALPRNPAPILFFRKPKQ